LETTAEPGDEIDMDNAEPGDEIDMIIVDKVEARDEVDMIIVDKVDARDEVDMIIVDKVDPEVDEKVGLKTCFVKTHNIVLCTINSLRYEFQTRFMGGTLLKTW
jgi:hypothetical protein